MYSRYHLYIYVRLYDIPLGAREGREPPNGAPVPGESNEKDRDRPHPSNPTLALPTLAQAPACRKPAEQSPDALFGRR